MTTSKHIYFPNLDGLRFVAALMVLLPHIKQHQYYLGLEFEALRWPKEFGKLGVVLFFVLSGYLITFLLLSEKSIFNKISIKKFYLRRILRIWPLYYLLIGFGLFIIPQVDFLDFGNYQDGGLTLKNKLRYILFLPNVAIAVPLITQTWSVGVEEQFYLIWPILLRYVKNKFVLFIGVIVLYYVISTVSEYYSHLHFFKLILAIINWFRIDCMAIGALFALILFKKIKILNFLYSKYTQALTYIILIILLWSRISIPSIHFQIFACLFGIVILNLSSNVNSIVSLKHPVLNYLGKISYGIYMWHPLAIVVVLKALKYFGWNNYLFDYLFSIVFTLLIACISYEYFEKYFLKLKSKYSLLKSGNSV